MVKPEIRIFVAHAKGDSDAALDTMRLGIQLAMQKVFGAKDPHLTLGRDDYAKHFARCGSWNAWGKDVATGILPVSREPRYHGIVVPAPDSGPCRVGAAAQVIVALALGTGKPVLMWSESGGLTKVNRVVKVAERDFKIGWQIS